MTFIRVVMRVHCAMLSLDEGHHMFGFFLRHANVIVAVQHEQRCFD